jgi:hypothetical protein
MKDARPESLEFAIAAIKQECIHQLMKHVPMTASKITDAHAQAAFKLDAARLSLKVPIARHLSDSRNVAPVPTDERRYQNERLLCSAGNIAEHRSLSF